MKSPDLIDYYRRRAGEYEAFYAKPERQADLLLLKKKLSELLKNARALEVACGTGYWTTVIANAARSVTATDLAEEPMRIARAKEYPKKNATFVEADAYALPDTLGRFDAAFAGFWWSHVPRERSFRIMKNFPSKEELSGLLPAPVHYRALQYHWLAEYRAP